MNEPTRDDGPIPDGARLTETLDALYELMFPYVFQAFQEQAIRKLMRMEPKKVSAEQVERTVRMELFFEGRVPNGTTINAGNSPEEAMESLRKATESIGEAEILERMSRLHERMLQPFVPDLAALERWLQGSTWRLIYEWLGLCVFVKRRVVIPSASQVYFDDSMRPQIPSSFEMPKGKQWPSIVASAFGGAVTTDELTVLLARIRREHATEDDFFPKPVREVLMGWDVNPVPLPRLEP